MERWTDMFPLHLYWGEWIILPCLALQGAHQHTLCALLGFRLNGVYVCVFFFFRVCVCVPSSHFRMFYAIQLDGAEAGCLSLCTFSRLCSLSCSNHTCVFCRHKWNESNFPVAAPPRNFITSNKRKKKNDGNILSHFIQGLSTLGHACAFILKS